MAKPRLYFLLPETDPCNDLMSSNLAIHDEIAILAYIQTLENLFRHLNYYDFDGQYDSENILNSLTHFEILFDYYPRPIASIIRKLLTNFDNWRDTPRQSGEINYQIYHQDISDHTFCETAEDGTALIPNAIFHIASHILGTPFTIHREHKSIEVESISNYQEIAEWFKNNHTPQRNFQISNKHGENREDIRSIGGELVYPFRSSLAEGQELVKSAIGITKKEIFNYQEGKGYVVFKFEGDTPQNMYHAYHVPDESPEVPEEIRRILKERTS